MMIEIMFALGALLTVVLSVCFFAFGGLLLFAASTSPGARVGWDVDRFIDVAFLSVVCILLIWIIVASNIYVLGYYLTHIGFLPR